MIMNRLKSYWSKKWRISKRGRLWLRKRWISCWSREVWLLFKYKEL